MNRFDAAVEKRIKFPKKLMRKIDTLDDTAIDNDRIDEVVLALLWLNDAKTRWAWKSFDWDALGRLHERDMISPPNLKGKAVYFTEKGSAEGERLFRKLFMPS